MLNVGLTGNIAAGKSTVVEHFRAWGATVIDADRLAREAQAPGTAVLAAIARRFGAEVIAADGSLDRDALRGKVMGDDRALAALNAIVHPAVQARRAQLADDARARGDLLVVHDIPLLFEALDPATFDVIVLVDAPVALRRTRLRTMRGLTNDAADRMIASQMDAERKRAKSDYVIENAGSRAALERAARAVFDALAARAARAALSAPARALALVAAGARDEPDLCEAIARRYAAAGVAVQRLTGRPAALAAALGAARPDAVLATGRAREAARAAWEAAGRPGPFLWTGDAAGPVVLDLRPWGAGYVSLGAEPGGTARADVFPGDKPLP